MHISTAGKSKESLFLLSCWLQGISGSSWENTALQRSRKVPLLGWVTMDLAGKAAEEPAREKSIANEESGEEGEFPSFLSGKKVKC